MEPNVDRAIGQVAEHLLLWRRENRVSLALLLGVSLKTVNRRISGERPWEASELALMSEHFGWPVEAFYAGPDALFGIAAPNAATDDTPRGTTRRKSADSRPAFEPVAA